jgi:rhomboid protease GluP
MTPDFAPPPPQVRVQLPVNPVWLTYVLLGLIGAVFLAQQASTFVLGDDWILIWGAKENTLIAQGQVWRLFTCIFIHIGWMHILFNGLALFNLGREVETLFGTLRFAVIFFIAGVGGAVASMVFSPNPSAEVVVLYRNRQILGARGRAALQNALVVAGLNLFLGFTTSFVDNWGHLGGLASGLLLAWLLAPQWLLEPPQFGLPPTIQDVTRTQRWRWLAVSGVVVGLLGVIGVTILFR